MKVILLHYLLFWASFVYGFSVDFPLATVECNEFSISFSGPASPPFTLLFLSPLSKSPEIVPVPDEAWDPATSQGLFNTTLTFSAGTEFVSVLHDSSGRGTGVVSDIYVVQPNEGPGVLDCARPPQVSEDIFTLSPSPPTECDFQILSWDSSRLDSNLDPQEPNGEFLNLLNFTSYIPRGQAFRLDAINAAGASSQAIWQVNVAAGLRYISLFEYYDRNGVPIRETSPFQQVQSSPTGVAACLGPQSPTVTAADTPQSFSIFTSTTTQLSSTSVSTTSPSPSQPTSSNGLLDRRNIMIIAGGSGIALVVAVVSIGICICCRRRRRDPDEENSAIKVDFRVKESDPNDTLDKAKSSIDSMEADSLPPLPTAEKLHKNPARGPKGVQRYRNISIASWGNMGPLPS